MLFVPPSMPYMVPEAEADDTNSHTFLVPGLMTSGCSDNAGGPTINVPCIHYQGCSGQAGGPDDSLWLDCSNVFFPENGIVVIEVHNTSNCINPECDTIPVDLYKAEIFINCSTYCAGAEVYSSWNLPERNGDVSCVTEPEISRWTGSMMSNSVCDGTITVTRSAVGVYQYKIDTGNLADGEHQIQGGTVYSETSSNSWSVTILVGSAASDTTPPIVNVPDDMTVIATGSYGINNFGPNSLEGTFIVTATDNVGVSQIYCSPPDFSGYWNVAVGTTEVTCTATDHAGNVGTASFTVTVIESVDPTLTVTAYTNATSPTGRTMNVDLYPCVTGESFSLAWFKGTSIQDYYGSTIPSFFPYDDGSSTYWPKFDSTGANSRQLDIPTDLADGFYVITWNGAVWGGGGCGGGDTIGTPDSTTVTIPALPAELTMNSPNISEFDNFGNWAEPKVKYNPIGDFDYDSGDYDTCLSIQVLKPDGTEASITYDTACVQHQGYNFEGYINDAFNASGWTMKICNEDYNICVEQNFTISFAFLDAVAGDTTPPVVTVPSNLTFTIENETPGSNRQLTASDVPPGAITATDNVGVVNDAVFCDSVILSVIPSLYGQPVFSHLPANLVFPSDPLDHWYHWMQQGHTMITHQVTCYADDAAGNRGTASFTVTMINTQWGVPDDTTPPTVNVVLTNISNSTSNPAGKTIPFTVSASDNVGVASGPTCSPSSGSNFPIGSTTVTCTATDAAGNVGTASFTVTVTLEDVADTTPPVVTVPDDMTVSTSNSAGETMNWTICVGEGITDSCDVTAIDDVPDNYELGIWTSLSCEPSSNTMFPIGTTTVTCTGWDTSGNVGTASFTVTVTSEAELTPTISAVAIVNSTSSTGRTLTVSADNQCGDTAWNLCDASYTAGFTIYKDGIPKAETCGWAGCLSGTLKSPAEFNAPGGESFWESRSDHWQIPIPADWEPGSYDITWSTADWMNSSIGEYSGSISFTIPAVPAAGEEEVVIPAWIKDNARWWDDGLIDDRNYVTGLQWLITNGIMTIPSTEQGTGSDDVIPSWVKNNARWWADSLIDDRNYVTGLQWLITNGVMTIG